MDTTPIQQKRTANPLTEAGIFSKLTFFYTYALFRAGFRKDLEDGDIYKISRAYESKLLGERLQKEWNKEVALKKQPNIFLPMLRVLGIQYAKLLFPYLLIAFVLLTAKPLLLGKILEFFNTEDLDIPTREEALLFSLWLSLCVVGYSLVHHLNAVGVEMTDIKAKAAVCSLIYRKSLKLKVGGWKNACGQAVTLMTKDTIPLECLNFSIYQTIVGPINIAAMCYIMYREIGVSSIFGTVLLLLLIPIQGFLGTKVSTYKLKTARETDQRIQVTQEILNSPQAIKMYCWQKYFYERINEIRNKEVHFLRILFYVKGLSFSLGQMSSKIALYVCIVSYIYAGYHLSARKAFVVIECLGTLHLVVMYNIPKGIAQIGEFWTAIHRITEYLLLPEVSTIVSCQNKVADTHVVLRNVTVPSQMGCFGEDVLSNVDLQFGHELTAVTGFVGCGKSTLMRTILRDINPLLGNVLVEGTVSYAPQQAWVFPGTVRQNIIFCEQFDRTRYEEVLRVCALEKDLKTFSDGDLSRITDRGLNLSGGQRSRISLARAVYKLADIYLLDDPLSAIDAHLGGFIFMECIEKFLDGKVRIFATQQHSLLKRANKVVILEDGKVKFVGSYQELRNCQDQELRPFVSEEIGYENDLMLNIDSVGRFNAFDELKVSKCVYDETKEVGSVKNGVYLTYFLSGGPFMFAFVTFLALVAQSATSYTEVSVSTWVAIEHKFGNLQTFNNSSNLQLRYDNQLIKYSTVLLSACILNTLKTFYLFSFCGNISSNLHSTSLSKVIAAKMSFFNRHMSANILNRFSRDLGVIDEIMPYVLFEVSLVSLMLLSVFVVSSIINPIFVIPSVLFAILLVLIRRFYIPVGRSLKRLQGTTRSAVVGHITSTFEGLTTVRAAGAQDVLLVEFDRLLDHYQSSFQMTLLTTRAFVYYSDLLCGLFISAIILTFPFLKHHVPAGEIGLAITQSLALTGFLQWGIRQWAELEVQMTSAERLLQYTKIDVEDRKIGVIPPDDWPNFGRLTFSDVILCYSSSSEPVLKGIDLSVQSCEKIGIVGRTGAGKSSVASSLLRLYEYEGLITIDGVDICTIPLDLLRSKIAVIPQDSVLFSGTLRSNLDPHGQYQDADLWKALEEVEVTSSLRGLNDIVGEGGSNFSIGQRQLICLARAILRRCSLIILDEATANVDPETDKLVQDTVARNFSKCTVITIAHRLHTVITADKIAVMDSGRVVEFDSPENLLANHKSLFYSMAKDSHLVI